MDSASGAAAFLPHSLPAVGVPPRCYFYKFRSAPLAWSDSQAQKAAETRQEAKRAAAEEAKRVAAEAEREQKELEAKEHEAARAVAAAEAEAQRLQDLAEAEAQRQRDRAALAKAQAEVRAQETAAAAHLAHPPVRLPTHPHAAEGPGRPPPPAVRGPTTALLHAPQLLSTLHAPGTRALDASGMTHAAPFVVLAV